MRNDQVWPVGSSGDSNLRQAKFRLAIGRKTLISLLRQGAAWDLAGFGIRRPLPQADLSIPPPPLERCFVKLRPHLSPAIAVGVVRMGSG